MPFLQIQTTTCVYDPPIHLHTSKHNRMFDCMIMNLMQEPATEPYSSIQDMVLGFDRTILQATFKVSEQVIDELLDGTKPPIITHVDAFCRGDLSCGLNKKKKKDKKDKKEKEDKKDKKEKEKKHAKLFNVFEGEKTIENCNGWSTVVTEKQLAALEGSSIGLFVVKLKAVSSRQLKFALFSMVAL